MGDLGLFGLPFPEEYGGSGADFFTLCLAIEEIARVDSSLAITLEAGRRPGRHADLPVRDRGAEAEVAPAAGERREALAGFGLTEPGAVRMPAPPHDRPSSRAASGSSTARSRSSRTPARRSPRSSPSLPSPRSPTATRRSRRSSSRTARPASRSARPTARWDGITPTRTSCRSTTCACPRRTCSASAARASGTS